MTLLLVGFLSTACRDHYAHGLRSGSLGEVKAPALILYFVESTPVVSIANEASDGTCLQLAGMHVTVDGVPQALDFVGGRSTGQTKGGFGPVNRTDSCDAARATIRVPNDPARTADVIEVDEGGTKLRAEFPNVLATMSYTTPPPSTVHVGDVFRVKLAPATVHGTGKFDGGNFATASLNYSAVGYDPIHLPTREISPNELEITVTPLAKPGSASIDVASVQTEVAATKCTATICVAAQRFVLSSPIVIR